jgi:hypothetical protein
MNRRLQRKCIVPAPQKGAWVIVSLLFFFMLINFVDKAVIGLAGALDDPRESAEEYTARCHPDGVSVNAAAMAS